MVKKVLHKFEVGYIQVLNEKGEADNSLMPKISEEEIKKIYKILILVRAFDQKAFNMQRQGRIGTYIQLKGQEACQVGAAFALRDEDWLFPMYRDSGMLIARKQPIVQILQYWSGDERGLISPKNTNNFPTAISVGTHIPHAVGAAWASKLQNKKQVALVSFGDGATSKGDFHEGLNFAGVFNVPLIFLCQNNQFAISVPRKNQTHSETIAQKAIAYGIKGIQVDGNDIFGVLKVLREAAEKARNGGGPTLIECYTFRMGDHSTSDDASRYCPKELIEDWKRKDPIDRLEKYMKKEDLLDDDYKNKVLSDAQDKIEKAVEEFEKVKSADKEDMFKFVFEEMTPRLKEEMGGLSK